jgi:hypothetical protein
MSNQYIASKFAAIPVGIHIRQGVDTVQTLTPPAQASILVIQAEGQVVRYIISSGGSNPSATFGFRLSPTEGERRIDLFQNARIRVIGEAAGGFINAQWMRKA